MLLLVALLPAAVLTVGNAYVSRARERLEVQQEAYRLVGLAATAQERLLESAGTVFVGISRLPSIAAGNHACVEDLNAIRTSALTFDNLLIIDDTGAIRCAAEPVRSGSSVTDRPWFRAALAIDALVLGPFETTTVASGTVMLARRVATRDGARIVAGAVNLGHLSEFLYTIPLPEQSAVSIADGGGTILARRPDHERWVGHAGPNEIIATALAEADGMTEALGVDGVRRLYGYRTIRLPGDDGLILTVGIPIEVAYAAAERRLALSLGVLGLVGVLTFLAARRMSTELLVRKIESLVKAARRMSAGDLTARTHEEWTPDELGELSRAFDAMAWTLQGRTEELERAVESLRALTARLESVREEERTRISREIHDDIGQALTGIRMDLDRIEERLAQAGLSPEQAAPLAAKVASLRGLVDAAIDTARRLSRQLRPSVLDVLGLQAAVEWQLEEVGARGGLNAELLADPDLPQLDEATTVTLFRILQESLTNVMRHAQASAVTVRLAVEDAFIVLEVMDNGRGFTPPDPSDPARSLGLLGMRERAAVLGGYVSVNSAPGEGTTVLVRIPLASAVAARS